MCGRYIPNTEDEIMEIREILNQISIRLSREADENLRFEGDIYPSNTVPIIYMQNGEPVIERVKWGFKKWDNKGIIINARSESAESSKFFAPYVNQYRCIIPAHGYYEWQSLPDNTKVKMELTKQVDSPLFMAGLYRKTPEGKEFVILTKEADENIKMIHDRMPVMLEKEQLIYWLDGTLLLRMLQVRNNNKGNLRYNIKN